MFWECDGNRVRRRDDGHSTRLVLDGTPAKDLRLVKGLLGLLQGFTKKNGDGIDSLPLRVLLYGLNKNRDRF